MTTVKKNLTLMNFADSYAVSVRGQLFKKEIDWVFLKNGSKPGEALFISYAYKGGAYTTYFSEVAAIFAKSGIKLIDILSGDPAGLIASAKAIVFGGGDYTALKTKMNSLITPAFNPYEAIKNRIEAGIPFIGWNEGSNIISPKYFSSSLTEISTGINAAPVQIVCNYRDSASNRAIISEFLKNNATIKLLIGQQVDFLVPDGTSVRLEESGGGMLDSATAPMPTVIRFKIVNGVLEAS
jgi:hypothetical protein